MRMDATAWEQRCGGAELVWSAEPSRSVTDEVGGLPPGRALDLAAGEGHTQLRT